MNATNTNEDSQQKKSEVELIIVSPTIDNEKSSIKPKFEHKEFKPRLGLVNSDLSKIIAIGDISKNLN